MTVYMQWHGGYSYAGFGDTETFPSIREAVAEFRHRARGGDRYYPCVEGSVAWLFFSDPAECVGDPYPDRVLEEGPRGGVRVERA